MSCSCPQVSCFTPGQGEASCFNTLLQLWPMSKSQTTATCHAPQQVKVLDHFHRFHPDFVSYDVHIRTSPLTCESVNMDALTTMYTYLSPRLRRNDVCLLSIPRPTVTCRALPQVKIIDHFHRFDPDFVSRDVHVSIPPLTCESRNMDALTTTPCVFVQFLSRHFPSLSTNTPSSFVALQLSSLS